MSVPTVVELMARKAADGDEGALRGLQMIRDLGSEGVDGRIEAALAPILAAQEEISANMQGMNDLLTRVGITAPLAFVVSGADALGEAEMTRILLEAQPPTEPPPTPEPTPGSEPEPTPTPEPTPEPTPGSEPDLPPVPGAPETPADDE